MPFLSNPTLGEVYTLGRPRAPSSLIRERGRTAYDRIKHDLERTIQDYEKLDEGYRDATKSRRERLKSVATALHKELQLSSDGSVIFSLDKLVFSANKNQPNQKKAIETMKSKAKGDLIAVLNHPNMAVSEKLGNGTVSYRLLIRYSTDNNSEIGCFYRIYRR